MATVVKMPKWGLTMTAGTVTDWLREEGSEVSEGDPLLTVETEKAVNDVDAPADGVLVKIVANQGAEVPVSGPVAIIAAPGESLSDDQIAALIASASPQAAGVTKRAGAAASGGRAARAAARDASGRVNASPAARKLAAELGIDLGAVEATGPNGRITSDDVERAAAAMADDPTPREEQVTLADGRVIGALVAGPGWAPKLVFLHGLGGSLATWQVVLGDLVDRYRVAAVDLPGHGASDKRSPDAADYSAAGLAAAVAEAIRALKLAPATVVGHSLGGAVGMLLALDDPDVVTSLVLVNSAGLGPDIGSRLIELMAGEPGEATARGLLELFYEDQSLVLDRGVEEMARGQQAEGAWPAQQAASRAAFPEGRQGFGLEGRLAGVAVPALVVWGAEDRVLPLEHGVAATSALPDAQLRVLPGIGHVPQVEAPSQLAQAIDRFVKSLS